MSNNTIEHQCTIFDILRNLKTILYHTLFLVESIEGKMQGIADSLNGLGYVRGTYIYICLLSLKFYLSSMK